MVRAYSNATMLYMKWCIIRKLFNEVQKYVNTNLTNSQQNWLFDSNCYLN